GAQPGSAGGVRSARGGQRAPWVRARPAKGPNHRAFALGLQDLVRPAPGSSSTGPRTRPRPSSRKFAPGRKRNAVGHFAMLPSPESRRMSPSSQEDLPVRGITGPSGKALASDQEARDALGGASRRARRV